MNGTSVFQKVGLLPPDHYHRGSYTSNGINSEQVPGTISFSQKRYCEFPLEA